MRVASFAEIEAEFVKRVERIVWCSVATVDDKGRPRSRILHPIWEGSIGWIATGRHSTKEKHLASTPFVSLSYWDQEQEQVYAECRADWIDDLGEKERVWDLFKRLPPPIGYDPGLFWPGGPSEAGCGFLRLEPWRIELWSLGDMMAGKPALIWKP